MKKRIVLLIACVALVCASIAGCARQPASAAPAPSQTSEPAPASSQPAEQPSETPPPGSGGQQITDMAGRTVTIPGTVEKAFGTDPVGTITLYTLAPEKLIGWNYELNDLERQNILPEYTGLPVYGMRDTFNAEAVIKAAPDVIFQMGSTKDAAIEQADELQNKLNIPVVVLSGKITDIPAAYTLMGQITGDTQRADELAGWSRQALERAANTEIPEGDKVTVYYGNGADSLETAPKGSDAAEVIELAGGVNVADLDARDVSERMIVSAEQIISWDPDLVFVNGEPKQSISGGGAAQTFVENGDFASLQAVQNGDVYGIPKSPFSWLDRPKAPNRIIGLVWAGKVMYPELYEDIDMNQQIKDFYDLFYHVRLSDDQVAELLDT